MSLSTNEVSQPSYLNKDNFQIVLENSLGHSQFSITNLTFKMGSVPGDNYCSIIYRVNVEYEHEKQLKTMSVIVKTLPINENNKFLDKSKVFDKERTVYSIVTPFIQAISGCAKIAAKCFFTIDGPIQTFFFEDLKALGYDCVGREVGLDEDHAKIVLHKLGIFHAGTMLLKKENDQVMNMFWHGFLRRDSMDDPLFKSLFLNNLFHLTSIVASWPGYEKIAKKLRHYHEHFGEIMLEHVQPTPDEVKVLNHGDLWYNNMMFANDPQDSHKVVDVVFIDFQFPFFTSPGIDINYFLNTSLQYDVLKNKRDELVSIYYKSLRSTLQQAKYENIPTEDAIRKEVLRKELYGLMIATTMFPMLVLDPEASKDNSFDELVDEVSAQRRRKLMYSSKRVIETLKYTLRRFDTLGVLDSF